MLLMVGLLTRGLVGAKIYTRFVFVIMQEKGHLVSPMLFLHDTNVERLIETSNMTLNYFRQVKNI